MGKKVYVCTGTCQARVSEEDFEDGLTRCGDKSCTRYNQPFEERDQDDLDKTQDVG